ncbi:hypothetical protein PHMEG_00016224 [Phytophthora megakarya]|uniref:Uncharacterized protein n=1 Tax=Phytophthora megakarya TaxID=4795 RepID=A0A225W1X4_9STRA|nr:hypothetical protein PHMEG_00016224 [Phytophthora megakarya]
MWGYFQAASTTEKCMLSSTRAPSGRCLSKFQAEFRRIPVISDLKAVRISLNLLPRVVFVALLQTMLWEAGHQLVNTVPTWNRWSNLPGIPDIGVREEIRKLGHLIGCERYDVLRASSYRPSLLSSRCEGQSSITVDSDGNTIMDEDTRMDLGLKVVMRLQVTGIRHRNPASSVE